MARYEGKQLGNYRLIRLLGEGHYTEVYQGEHIEHKTIAAIKLDLLGCQSPWNEELRNDVNKILHLKHPHIIPALDFGIDTSYTFTTSKEGVSLFLVMDYAYNGSLRQSKQKGSRFPLNIIIEYTNQIAAALTYLHNQNLYHLHIKPENLLFKEKNNILLGDFGIHWTNYNNLARASNDIIWHIAYNAPESLGILSQLANHQAIDQYALGVVIYECLCGHIPFQIQGLSRWDFSIALRKILNDPPQPLHEKVPGISPAIEAVLMRALAKVPERRFESVEAFAKALEEAAFPPKVILNSPNLAGQQLGNYRLIRLLGSGGFADVYLGQHRRLNTFAAIKVLHSRMSDDDVEEFEKEAQTIANLRHPSIVRVLDFVVEGDTPFLVMDYAANGTLRQRHPKGSRLPLNSVVSYVKQVAGALQFAHEQKLIHRDVKPENMLLGPNNEILLSDFGIAAVAHSTRSLQTQGTAGTIYYMAPEQIQGKPRPASDQYALAAVAYEWLSGSRPFNGTYLEIVTQHLTAPLPPLREKNPFISPAVEHVLQIALAKDPHKRFASVQVFANALEKASKQ